MLVGRKLLLADDSITIQKVVALTFADEGIEVLAVDNGADAIEQLEQFWPDVVLADVYMPKMTGLQVCDYIKNNDKLKHIPVMLLVGSFEPFDEAEARRVGADDTLTKPFQSIRTLVDKVGELLGRTPAPENPEQVLPAEESGSVDDRPVAAEPDGARVLDGAETLEFPDPDEAPPEVMDSGKLELVTAETRDLAPELHPQPRQPAAADWEIDIAVEEQQMETHLTSDARPELPEDFGDTLLDLSHLQAAPLGPADDVILDIDFDSPGPELCYSAPVENLHGAVAVDAASATPLVTSDEGGWTTETEEVVEWDGDIQITEPDWGHPTPFQGEVVSAAEELQAAAPATTEEPEPTQFADLELPPAAPAAAPAPATGQIMLEHLSAEAIDAIARRVVEQLSEKAVQEIAWEVVPQLAELLIKRKLEESR